MIIEKTVSRRLCEGSVTDFIKSHVLSPDGRYSLAISESHYVTNWKLSDKILYENLYYPPAQDSSSSPDAVEEYRNDDITLDGVYDIGEAIYDCIWYPHMNSNNPSSCCFVTTSRDHPIHLWNCSHSTNLDPGTHDSDPDSAPASGNGQGHIQASYLGYNHLDELDTALSLSFNLSGEKLYAGYHHMIRSFDLSTPGRHATSSYPTITTKKDHLGQKGIISSLAFNPMRVGVFAAGSYDIRSGIYLYHENMKRACSDHLTLTGGEEFGVTCMKWSNCGNYLWAGGRNNSVISCYDIRAPKIELGR
jgi:telomerase Cajal body protein 1